MSEPIVNAVGGRLLHTVDFSLEVPQGVSVTGIAFSLPDPLQKYAESADLGNNRSTVGIEGATHAGLWLVRATATLSNGESVVKSFAVRGFNA